MQPSYRYAIALNRVDVDVWPCCRFVNACWQNSSLLLPRTGRPDIDPPKVWNKIPGARGCTPQSRGFRDTFKEFQKVNAKVFGLSTQDTEYQKEAVQRLQLPFDLLSDSELFFAKALKLPTFEVEFMKLIKRLTMVVSNGGIEKVFYPVFPPDKNGEQVLNWLKQKG